MGDTTCHAEQFRTTNSPYFFDKEWRLSTTASTIDKQAWPKICWIYSWLLKLELYPRLHGCEIRISRKPGTEYNETKACLRMGNPFILACSSLLLSPFKLKIKYNYCIAFGEYCAALVLSICHLTTSNSFFSIAVLEPRHRQHISPIKQTYELAHSPKDSPNGYDSKFDLSKYSAGYLLMQPSLVGLKVSGHVHSLLLQ